MYPATTQTIIAWIAHTVFKQICESSSDEDLMHCCYLGSCKYIWYLINESSMEGQLTVWYILI